MEHFHTNEKELYEAFDGDLIDENTINEDEASDLANQMAQASNANGPANNGQDANATNNQNNGDGKENKQDNKEQQPQQQEKGKNNNSNNTPDKTNNKQPKSQENQSVSLYGVTMKAVEDLNKKQYNTIKEYLKSRKYQTKLPSWLEEAINWRAAQLGDNELPELIYKCQNLPEDPIYAEMRKAVAL